MTIAYQPDCPVCMRCMPKVEKSPKTPHVQVAKRSCPRCKRRFRFEIRWLPDKMVDVHAERVEEFKRRAKP